MKAGASQCAKRSAGPAVILNVLLAPMRQPATYVDARPGVEL